MRYFIELAYNGTDFHGWQRQKNAHSVQAELEDALANVLREEIAVMGCGRTDAGVHAEQFFAHFETESKIECDQTVFRLNSCLPKTVAIFKIFPVNEKAHARFSATQRTYRYLVSLQKNPFLIRKSCFFYQAVNIKAMNEAAEIIKTYEDFSCFSKSGTQNHTNLCGITEAHWVQNGNELEFTISANRFLRNMVRAIVGTMLDIGTGKIAPTHVHEIIKSKNRSNAGASVPAAGLYLHKVSYPKDILQWQK